MSMYEGNEGVRMSLVEIECKRYEMEWLKERFAAKAAAKAAEDAAAAKAAASVAKATPKVDAPAQK